MSNPLAVSILAKLGTTGEWWPCNGNLIGARNGITIDTDVHTQGYEAGLNHQRLKAGARGYCTLPTPGSINSSTALTIGGRFTYGGSSSASGCISLSDGLAAKNEVLVINVNAGLSVWSASSWASNPTNYSAVTDGGVGIPYPVTVKVTDSVGQTATSPQVIEITSPGGIVAGQSYDVIGVWEADDTLSIYVNGVFRKATTLPRPAFTKSSILLFQTGNYYQDANSPCAHEGMFYAFDAFTAAEIAYINNNGARKSYAQIVADAA